MKQDSGVKRPRELPSFPMLQMFGGLIGVLLVVVTLAAINVYQTHVQQTSPENIVGLDKVELSSRPQIKFSLFKDHILIVETGVKVPLDELLRPRNRVTEYLRPQIRAINTRQKAVFLLLYPGSNRTMFTMRELLVRVGAGYFNLLLLNRELIEQLKNPELAQ